VEGNPLRIAGRQYYRGLGMAPGTRVTYFLGGGYEWFSGEVGVDDETRGAGSAVCQVYGDGVLLHESEVLRGGQPPRRFQVSVRGRRHMTLAVADAGDGPSGDHADWGDTYLRAAPAPVVSLDEPEGAGIRDLPATQPADGRPSPPRVEVETSLGRFVIELDDERTPLTTDNFLDYVDSRFYDGTIFHRVIDGFIVQGGGFTPDLVRKPTRDPIPNEASAGAGNTRGTVAMARNREPDSATSQFYINLGDNRRLDAGEESGYCVFGRVIEGMDVVDRIAAVPTEDRGGLFQALPIETVMVRSIRRK
jgi:peptidyl-prolyl cis-trans isomerase A (cyclophilin A)